MNLSVIIITWNAKHFLEKCLKSVYENNKDFDFELILIDNNSTDGTKEFIKTNYSQTILIENEFNKGVAPARNQGLKIAKGSYILILDVDTEILTSNAFEIIINYMDENPSVGLLGAQLIFPSGETQYSCLKFPSIWVKLFNRLEFLSFIKNSNMMRNYYMSGDKFSDIKEVDYVIGAFQFFRKEIVEKVGLYDDKIFYGPEDIDFCLRVKKNKYKVIYFPKVKLYHFYQRITKKFFTRITFLHIKGLFHFFWKHKYINYPKY